VGLQEADDEEMGEAEQGSLVCSWKRGEDRPQRGKIGPWPSKKKNENPWGGGRRLGVFRSQGRGKLGAAALVRDRDNLGLGFFLLFCPLLVFSFSSVNKVFSPPPFFHCNVAFIGEVWLGQNHNGPSTFPFLSFSFFLLILIFLIFLYF